ncbi:MAG: polyprenyl synthetase family protein [bacterium]
MSQKIVMNYVEKYKEKIDCGISDEIERRLREVEQISSQLVPVLTAIEELSVGGKRLRAMLTLLGYEMAGGKVSGEVIKAGVVMELFHLGLLIQDDVMDRDIKRRGVATIHTRFDDLHLGEAIATSAGDVTFGWGMETIAGLDLPQNQVNAAIKVWGKYFSRVGYGQMLDVMRIADEKTLLTVLALKSGEYSCVLPLLLGATLGGGNKKLLESLEKYGMELGWVFQLRDDWLAEYGDSEKMGKLVGSDSREGKKTLATMYGREKLEAEIKDHVVLAKKIARNLQGLSSQADLMCSLVKWIGTREN